MKFPKLINNCKKEKEKKERLKIVGDDRFYTRIAAAGLFTAVETIHRICIFNISTSHTSDRILDCFAQQAYSSKSSDAF